MQSLSFHAYSLFFRLKERQIRFGRIDLVWVNCYRGKRPDTIRGWLVYSFFRQLSEQQTMKHWGKKDGCPQSAQHFVVWQFDGVTTTIIREQLKCDFLLCTHLLLGELSFFSSCSIRHNGCLSFLQSRYENIHYTVHMRVCIYYNACLLCWR